MAPTTLLSLFPKPEDVLTLTPEDFGGLIVELVPPLLQNGMFNPAALLAQVYQGVGPSYPPGSRRAIELAVAEAISWLVTEGRLVPDPGRQPSPGFYVPTRRAQTLKTRTDVEVFRKGRILPTDLLPTLFAEKVVPLFRRGDHDVAVFRAFKEVEVAVRHAPLTDIEPPYRVVRVAKDRRGFDRSRFISVLKGIVTAAEIEPVPLLELPVYEFAPNTYRYRVRNGFHRFYASIVAGFECLAAIVV